MTTTPPTRSQIAHGLAILDHRTQPNDDDYRLADVYLATHPNGVETTAADQAAADDFLRANYPEIWEAITS